jgi:hypothetical protein
VFARTRSAPRTGLLDPGTEWTRRRVQLLLAAVLMVLAGGVAGAWWSLYSSLHGRAGDDPGSSTASDASNPSGTRSAKDELAERPLPSAPLEAAQPGPLSSARAATLEMPPPTQVGDVGVASGYPHTPEGALAQLAAIDTTALASASVRGAQDVIEAWALPGGPTTQNWSGVHAVAALLGGAGMSGDARHDITISAEPAMGFIKGTVGDDFVVPCINFIVTATTTATTTVTTTAPATGQPQQVAAADCQRMQWQDGRWMIGAGEEPAPAPSLWPGSQASIDAGYHWLQVPQS